jgi:hypothetical protein
MPKREPAPQLARRMTLSAATSTALIQSAELVHSKTASSPANMRDS